MIKAIFNGYDTATAYGLYQWDYGQRLQIVGLNLPRAVDIDFSLQERGGASVPRVGLTTGGVTEVAIPDEMLENGGTPRDYTAYAFVYVTDENSGKTTHKIILPVTARPRPEAWNTPEDTNMFRDAIAAVNESADRAEKAAEEIMGYTDTAKSDIDTYVAAKESELRGKPGTPGEPGRPGTDGITPHIGDNGNWWIGDEDTGVGAAGTGGNAGNTKPFEKTLLYYGYPSMIGGSSSPEAAVDVYKSYDMCIFGDHYEFAGHEEHENTKKVFELLSKNYPDIKLVGYVPIGVQNIGSDSGLEIQDIKERIDAWKMMGADGIFLDEFGYDYGVTRDRQNECVSYCHNLGMFCIANSWETQYAFSRERLVIDWMDSFSPNPEGLAPELGKDDYYLFENLFYSVSTDYDGNIKYDDNGQPVILSSSAWRINTIDEYFNRIDAENGDTASWKDLYGTKLMSLDAIPSVLDQKEMYRLRTMSVIGASLFNMDAVAFGDENWGASGTYFDWTLPSSLNLGHPYTVNAVKELASVHWYEFIYNETVMQVNSRGGLRVMLSESAGYTYYHMSQKNKTENTSTWSVIYRGEVIEMTLEFVDDASANIIINGTSYTATRDTTNDWTDERYYQEWPSSWTANINGHIYTIVFDLQYPDDIAYDKNTHYCLVDGDNIQNIWQTVFGFQEYVYGAVDMAESAVKYIEESVSDIRGAEEKINNAVSNAENAIANANSELETARKAQLEASGTLDAAMGDLSMLTEGFAFKEVQW